MTYIRLANFIEAYRINNAGEEVVTEHYHNAEPGAVLRYRGKDYQYLSFIYQGAAKSRTGDNLEAALVLSVNQLSQGITRRLLLNRDHVRVYSVSMTPESQVSRTLTTEEWLAASMTYDTTTLELILSSGIDAVGANAPTRVLTQKLVGHLPTTGSIQSG